MPRPRLYGPEAEKEIHYLNELGWAIRDIADETGVSKSTVHRILNRVTVDDEDDVFFGIPKSILDKVLRRDIHK